MIDTNNNLLIYQHSLPLSGKGRGVGPEQGVCRDGEPSAGGGEEHEGEPHPAEV